MARPYRTIITSTQQHPPTFVGSLLDAGIIVVLLNRQAVSPFSSVGMGVGI